VESVRPTGSTPGSFGTIGLNFPCLPKVLRVAYVQRTMLWLAASRIGRASISVLDSKMPKAGPFAGKREFLWLLRRRLRVSSGTVQFAAMTCLTCPGVMGMPSVSRSWQGGHELVDRGGADEEVNVVAGHHSAVGVAHQVHLGSHPWVSRPRRQEFLQPFGYGLVVWAEPGSRDGLVACTLHRNAFKDAPLDGEGLILALVIPAIPLDVSILSVTSSISTRAQE
jgi:hypothetical protein